MQNVGDSLEFGLLKLFVEDVQIGAPPVPVPDLIQRACAFCTLLRVLVGNNLFDLPSPVDDRSLQPLQQVLVSSSGLGVTQVLVRDVQRSPAFGGMRCFGQGCHELVELSNKLLFDALGPVFLSQELRQMPGVHLVEDIV